MVIRILADDDHDLENNIWNCKQNLRNQKVIRASISSSLVKSPKKGIKWHSYSI